MAVLSEQDRQDATNEFMRKVSRRRDEIAISKTQCRTLINNADNHLDTSYTDFNTGLPAPIRTSLTRQLKERALSIVARKRVPA